MLNQKKIEIFLVKFRKSLAKQFLEVASKNTKTLSAMQKVRAVATCGLVVLWSRRLRSPPLSVVRRLLSSKKNQTSTLSAPPHHRIPPYSFKEYLRGILVWWRTEVLTSRRDLWLRFRFAGLWTTDYRQQSG